MAGRAFIGISGWNYDAWNDDFYDGVPKKRWLEHSAERFSALEVNATFYRAQSEDTYRDWIARTPKEFVFAAKAHRYATHSKRLKDPDDVVRRVAENMRALEPKLKVVLWQLPASASVNIERLEAFGKVLGRRWSSVRHALEFRHPSWFGDDVADVLARYRISACMSDAADWPTWDAVTTNLVYVRLHGHTRTYASKYSTRLLEDWVARIRPWLCDDIDVHVYFDNDQEGAAPNDALRLIELLKA
jgi:uncharacterized protein YecE (DUF72 family)